MHSERRIIRVRNSTQLNEMVMRLLQGRVRNPIHACAIARVLCVLIVLDCGAAFPFASLKHFDLSLRALPIRASAWSRHVALRTAMASRQSDAAAAHHEGAHHRLMPKPSPPSSPTARPTTDSKLRVAVCFFGLTRSLKITIHSIQAHIFNTLTLAGWEFDVYLHTYNQSSLTNPRSGEINATLDPGEWRLLRPKRWSVQPVDAHLQQSVRVRVAEYAKKGDPWGEHDTHTSMSNLLMQLNSIACVTDLWQAAHDVRPYHAVIYLRPDVWYFNEVNVPDLEAATANASVIFVPDFHSWGGVNDRFAMGHPVAAAAWARRDALADEYVFGLGLPLHSEKLAAHAISKGGLTVRATKIRFGRVRANGMLSDGPQGPGMEKVPGKRFQKNELGMYTVPELG